MGQTADFLKKTAQELNDLERDLKVHPLSSLKGPKRKRHYFIITTLIIAYSFIIYAVYDLYSMKKNSYKVVENFLNVNLVLSDLEKSILSSVDVQYTREREIKSEEDFLNQIAEKSLKLPDLSTIPKNIPPISIQSSIPESNNLVLSKYDFFIKKAREYESTGNYKYAIFFYLRAFAEKQSDYNLKYKIATLYYQIGQDDLAMESAKDALNIKSDFLPAIEFLINIYSKTGKRPSGFMEILERAKNTYPDNKDILYSLAKLYKENGNYKAYEEIIGTLNRE